MPIEFHRDGPWDLPEGWVWARLGDVAEINSGTSFDDLPDAEKIPFVPMAAMAEETGVVDFSQRRPVAELRKGFTRFQRNDVLFAKITPCMENGKIAVVEDLPSGYGAGSTEFHVMRSAAFDPRYLWHWVVRQAFRRDAQRNMSGSAGQMRVPVDYLRNVSIAIPPLAEQRRIVARIDELFTEIADGADPRPRRPRNLAPRSPQGCRHRRTDARLAGDNNTNETAVDVLAALSGTRVSLGGGRQASETRSALIDRLPELPRNWTWTTLGEISETVRNGTSSAPRADRNEFEILRISAVRPMAIDLSQIRFLNSEQAAAAAAFVVESGDFLFTRYNGSADLVGVGAIYHDKSRFYPDKLIRVRLWPQLRDYAPYIEVAVNTWMSRKHIAANIKTTAGQQGLSGESLKNTPIPLPPRAEATAIMRTIGKIDNDTDRELKIASGSAPALRQSVLKAAFEGRLVARDPRDEPAEKLLARLSDTTTPTKSKGRRTRAGATA
jgi:type I restriction enzyme S subunit